MNYLVILDANSTIGKIYGEKADRLINDGQTGHPALLCSEIAIDHPVYLFATRPLTKEKSHQSLHIPHHAVVAIYRVNEEADRTIGFQPS